MRGGVAEAAIMTCWTTLIGDYRTGRVRDRCLVLRTMCAAISATAFFVLGVTATAVIGLATAVASGACCCPLC